MTLPSDTAAALRDEAASAPLSMPPSFYTDPAMLPLETERVFLNGWVCVGRADVWIYPSFVAAISPNSAVWMSITPEGAESLQTRWGVVAREALSEGGEARERFEFARAFNAEDRARLLEVQKGLRSRFATRGHLAPPDYEGTVVDFYRYTAVRLDDAPSPVRRGARTDSRAEA